MATAAEYARQQALIDRELATRQILRLDRFARRGDLSSAARELVAADRAELERQIRAIDARLAPRWPHAVLGSPPAAQRLREAQAELSGLRGEMLSDRRRSTLTAAHRSGEV